MAMQMRMPVHVWAMLSRGKEAESIFIDQDVGHKGRRVEGVGFRERWREWDGERHWKWRDKEGVQRARQSAECVVRRMAWVKKDGVWRPRRWEWEPYNRRKEWDNVLLRRYIATPFALSEMPWAFTPQEILLRVVQYIKVVSYCVALSRVP